MKIKQLQVIKDQHKRYLERISHCPVDAPSVQCHIVHALVRGETVPQLNPLEISNAAREAVASCSYGGDRTLKFGQVFRAPASYTKAKRDFDVANERTEKAAAKYKKEADTLLLKAELSDAADADEVSAELRLLAIKHGIDA